MRIRQMEPDVAAASLLSRDDTKPVAFVNPGPCALVPDEKIGEFLILQAQAVVRRPIQGTLTRTGILPQIVAPCHRPLRSIQPPRALDVQRVVSNGTGSRRVASNGTEMKHEHVGRSPDDRESEPDEYIEGTEALHRGFLNLCHSRRDKRGVVTVSGYFGRGAPAHDEASAARAVGRHALIGQPHARRQLPGLPEYVDRNAAARIPIAADPQPARLQQGGDPLADADRAILV